MPNTHKFINYRNTVEMDIFMVETHRFTGARHSFTGARLIFMVVTAGITSVRPEFMVVGAENMGGTLPKALKTAKNPPKTLKKASKQ